MPSKQYLSSNYQRGSSLIELSLVILIVSILAATVIPKFLTVSIFSQRTYFDEVIGSLRYAQKVAVGMGCDTQVSITSSSLTITLRSACRSGAFSQGLRDPATGSNTYVKSAPSGVVLSGSSSFPIYFDRLGRAHNSGGSVANATLAVNSQNISIVGETGYTYEP